MLACVLPLRFALLERSSIQENTMNVAAIDIPDGLIGALGAELQDHARGFASRGDGPDGAGVSGHPAGHSGLGDLWREKDFAWRALLNPAFQVEVMLAIGNRNGQALTEEALERVCPILEALAESMPDDATIDLMAEEDGVIEVLSSSLHAYFKTGLPLRHSPH